MEYFCEKQAISWFEILGRTKKPPKVKYGILKVGEKNSSTIWQ